MRSPTGASAELLRLARRKRVTLLANVPLALEYEAQCRRGDHRRAAGLTEREALAFVDGVLALVEPVETFFLWRPQLRDPADEMVLEAAINGGAAAIVTFNRRDYRAAERRFDVRVLLPREALERIRP